MQGTLQIDTLELPRRPFPNLSLTNPLLHPECNLSDVTEALHRDQRILARPPAAITLTRLLYRGLRLRQQNTSAISRSAEALPHRQNTRTHCAPNTVYNAPLSSPAVFIAVTFHCYVSDVCSHPLGSSALPYGVYYCFQH